LLQNNPGLEIFFPNQEEGVGGKAFMKEIKIVGFLCGLKEPINRAFSILGDMPFGEKLALQKPSKVAADDLDYFLATFFAKKDS